jgi:hypothetical protein
MVGIIFLIYLRLGFQQPDYFGLAIIHCQIFSYN